MIPDLVSYAIAGFLLAVALRKRRAIFVTFAVCFSLAFDRFMFEDVMNMRQITTWAATLAIKDFLLATVIFYRAKPIEFWVAFGLMASCFVNYWIKIEAQSHGLALFYYRPDIMSLVVASWFASIAIILLGGGISGGKRYRRRIHTPNGGYAGFLFGQAQKVLK